jgi:CRP/FNR family cyclic AMP-dependent transcriptional regulator
MRNLLDDVLDPEERRQLISAARRRRFARNEVVFHEGDPASSLHLLISGHVSVRVALPDGNSVTLAIVGPGQTVGELALLGRDGRRAATVTALEKCETLSIQREQFDAMRREHPRLDRLLAEILADEVRRLDSRLLEFLYLPAEKRVLRRLAWLGRMYRPEGGAAHGSAGKAVGGSDDRPPDDSADGLADGTEPTVTVPLTQDVIAGLAGASRPTTNQALRALEAAQVIRIGRARIEILDAGELRQRAR